ncbi:hypothetical protein QBC35DRAFT_457446 [Podospora australis]|uniref:Uncharacterized protein n=1 Tax=Podospora australis TaxID=1536484 RepID=A0AAN7AD92_9PEZI|nr:hypothetical protein QBC35DRAFT_457446 [Podospora australis]
MAVNHANIDLSFIENEISDWREGREIFDLLITIFEFNLHPEAMAVHLAYTIYFYFQRAPADRLDEMMSNTWVVVLTFAQCIPPQHPWQYSLAKAVSKLHGVPGPVSDNAVDPEKVLWEDLPHFENCLREIWNEAPTYDGTESPQLLTRFRNLNSFLSRVLENEFYQCIDIPYTQMQNAMNQHVSREWSAAFQSRLWDVTEWVLHCGKVLLDGIIIGERVDTNEPAGRARWVLTLAEWMLFKAFVMMACVAVNHVELVDNSLRARLRSTQQMMEACEARRRDALRALPMPLAWWPRGDLGHQSDMAADGEKRPRTSELYSEPRDFKAWGRYIHHHITYGCEGSSGAQFQL